MSHETETYIYKDYKIKCEPEGKNIICSIEFEKNSERIIRFNFEPNEFTIKFEKAMEEVIKKLKKTRGEKSWKH